MENASKALLIAGAVLIVILLIGIGMLIYSKSTRIVDTAASIMNTQELQSYNSNFTIYEGIQKGPSVKSLISTVIANNANYPQIDNPTLEQNAPCKIFVKLDASVYDDVAKKLTSHNDKLLFPETIKTKSGMQGSPALSLFSANLNTSATYNISFEYYNSGILKQINISYK